MNYTTLDEDHKLPVEVVTRAPVFQVLTEGPTGRRELEDRLDISRATCHRIVRSFEDRGLITRTDRGYELSALGRAIADEVMQFTENVATATELVPLLEGISPTDIDFNLGMFTGATVTRPKPENPYPPINRFMELVRDSTMLRSLDKTSIAPPYVDELAELVVDEGLQIKAIYGHDVIDQLLSEYPDKLKPAFETGRVSFRVHDNVSFGLSIFDDRIGIRAYDSESGAYTIFVDTGSAEAYTWAEDVYESYWQEAHRLSAAGDFPNWAHH